MLEIRTFKGKGRGIVTTEAIPEATLIEVCPILEFKVGQDERHILEHYAFRWTPNKIALVLGFGSLYNHSFDPNAWFDFDWKEKLVYVRTLVDIPKETEICINYAGSCTDPKEANLWFHTK